MCDPILEKLVWQIDQINTLAMERCTEILLCSRQGHYALCAAGMDLLKKRIFTALDDVRSIL